MPSETLFHAYIVGGAREDARKHIDEMLAAFGLGGTQGAQYVVSEQVSFSIDAARALREWQEFSSVGGERKVYVAYTDFITREAENALLKTLEEPVEGTHIFIAVPNPDVLLGTLLSRVRVVMPSENEAHSSSLADAKKFLTLPRAERLAYITKLVEKSDDDEAAAEVRERSLALANNLEKALSIEPQKNRAKLELLLRLKKYLYIPGASSKMILETVALTI